MILYHFYHIFLHSIFHLLKIHLQDYGDNGVIKFEGEILNGERNGKGKEYDENGFLIFEGEYLNGERNGKGNEYHDYDKKLRFEGEYMNGLRHGIGKEYYDNGKIKY